jgi:hypothetical protein
MLTARGFGAGSGLEISENRVFRMQGVSHQVISVFSGCHLYGSPAAADFCGGDSILDSG